MVSVCVCDVLWRVVGGRKKRRIQAARLVGDMRILVRVLPVSHAFRVPV
jgi:hypothetical protein